MIRIADKHDCCGCEACVQICPKACVSFEEDPQGFLYPRVDLGSCVDCGLCEKVCPFLNNHRLVSPIQTYAAINKDDDAREASSSGGIFILLAQKVIEKRGVVFGARFDANWNVEHGFTDTKEGLSGFLGSKYVQSRIGQSFVQVRAFLKEERLVLFSGTSCQIAALHLFLGRDYDNLLSVEVLCSGVPSPLVWRLYLSRITKNERVLNVNFRYKEPGWSHYSYSLMIRTSENLFVLKDDPYMNAMALKLSTRPACSKCPTRLGRSAADIILGDCWGIWDIDKNLDDNRGVSLVNILTRKGDSFVKDLNCSVNVVNNTTLIKYNAGLKETISEHPKHDMFFREICKRPVDSVLNKYTKRGLKTRVLSTVKRLFH